MFRKSWHFFFIILSLGLSPLSPLFAEDGYIGVNPGLHFYSMIDDGVAKMNDSIIKRRLKEYGTFAGFGRTCRAPAAWLDSTPMNEQLLQEISNGLYSRLIMLANSKKVQLGTTYLNTLTTCLTQSYRDLKVSAANEQSILEQAGSLGLYTDGDAGNSDYDIIADIEKINRIIFKEEEKYTGTHNMMKSSFADFLAGKPVAPTFANAVQGIIDNGGVVTGSGNTSSPASTASQTTTPSTPETPVAPIAVGIGDVCTTTGKTGITSVDNMVDASFLSELQDTLIGGNTVSSNLGVDYGAIISPLFDSGANARSTISPNSGSDFFHEIPCDNILCIKVRMVNGGGNLLAGGQNKSIEAIIERHIQIMGPIADSNLAGQKMTNNMYQLNWSSLKFSNIIPKPLIYVAYKPQQSRRDKKDDTPASKDAKLQAAAKCAMYSAGLSSDLNRANNMIGESYGVTNASTTANVLNTVKNLGPVENAKEANGCTDVYYSQGRTSFYNSFSTDITEIGAFTAGMIEEINAILESGKAIDKLRVD